MLILYFPHQRASERQDQGGKKEPSLTKHFHIHS